MLDLNQKSMEKEILIEGVFEKGQSVILVEDLISTGKSSLEAAEALNENGMQTKGIASIFTYGFDIASKNFDKENCEYVSLCDYNTLLAQAINEGYINKEEFSLLKDWNNNPSIWKK